MKTINLSDRSIFWILLLVALIVYCFGLVLPIIDVDASQYASMSREMLETGSWLQVKERFKNYLDKPPLLFWVSAFSFKIFGVSDFAYRLPTFLFTLLSFFAVGKWTEQLFDIITARLTVLILGCSQAYFLFNQDIRTDALLAACVAIASWQLWLFLEHKRWINWLIGFSFLALGLMSKGPIALVIVICALAPNEMKNRGLNILKNYKIYLGLLWCLLLLSPMLWGLYLQYGWVGLKFFFWTQSFGRITGENVWHDNTTYFNFTHVFLWAFLPFSLLAYWSIAHHFYQIFQRKSFNLIPLTGFILPFISLSLSHYKLPHYIFPLFCFAAMLTSRFIINDLSQNKKWLKWGINIQNFIVVILWLLIGIILTSVFDSPSIWILFVILLFIFGLLFFYFYLHSSTSTVSKIVVPSLLTVIAANFVLNVYFYPNLTKYQSGSEIGQYIEKRSAEGILDKSTIYVLDYQPSSLDYYGRKVFPSVKNIDSIAFLEPKAQYILAQEYGYEELKKRGAKCSVFYEHRGFPVSRLSFKRLNPKEREKELKSVFILKLE